MRKLLLASSGEFVVSRGLKLLFGEAKRAKLAYVTTASKGTDDKSYISRHKKMLREAGCDFEEIDIEGKNRRELEKALEGKNAVWIEGGNTFYLLKAVKGSGFDKVLKKIISEGTAYIGSSAGSYIACPTVEMSTWKKPGEEKNRFGLNDLAALNFVPFLVKVHYDPSQKEFLKEKISAASAQVRFLTDNQAFLVEDEKATLVGEGEEIRL